MAGHILLCHTTRPFCPREQWTTATSVKLQDVGGQLYAMLDFPSHEEVHRAIVQGPLATELPADAAHPEDPDPEPMDEAMARRGTGRCIAGRASLTPGDLIPLGGHHTNWARSRSWCRPWTDKKLSCNSGGGQPASYFSPARLPQLRVFFLCGHSVGGSQQHSPRQPKCPVPELPPPKWLSDVAVAGRGFPFHIPRLQFSFPWP